MINNQQSSARKGNNSFRQPRFLRLVVSTDKNNRNEELTKSPVFLGGLSQGGRAATCTTSARRPAIALELPRRHLDRPTVWSFGAWETTTTKFLCRESLCKFVMLLVAKSSFPGRTQFISDKPSNRRRAPSSLKRTLASTSY